MSTRPLASLFALGLAFGVHLVAAAPAQAVAPTVQWNTPAPNGVQPNSAFDFSATVRTSSGTLTRNITVTFTGPAGRTPPDIVRTPGSVNAYTVVQAVAFPWNGAYGVNLTASAKRDVLDNDTSDRTFPNSFTVDALPATPSITAATDTKTRFVTVSWSANTEPDMVGYEVQKESSTGTWTAFAVTDRTSIVDESTATKGGTYRYQVRALRQSAQPDKLNPSLYSSPAAATVAAPPTPPTSTTQPPGGGGSGGEEETTPGTGSGGTGGSTGGAGSGGAETGRSGTGSRSSGPALATSGKVDLSDYAALLAQQKAKAGGSGDAGAEDDGTYEGTLPFKARAGGEGDDGEGEAALGEEPASDSGNRQALGFLAGGLLATVLAMHVLWVRSEVHRAEALEALVPVEVVDAPPAARRRRRPTLPPG